MSSTIPHITTPLMAKLLELSMMNSSLWHMSFLYHCTLCDVNHPLVQNIHDTYINYLKKSDVSSLQYGTLFYFTFVLLISYCGSLEITLSTHTEKNII